MYRERLRVLLACNRGVRDRFIGPQEIARLEAIADWDWFPCEGGGLYDTNTDPAVAQALKERIGDVDALIVCHGAPTISDELLDAAPSSSSSASWREIALPVASIWRPPGRATSAPWM